MPVKKVLIIGADRFINTVIHASIMTHPDWQDAQVSMAHSTADALREMAMHDYHILLVDAPSLDTPPLENLIHLRSANKTVSIIIMNAPGMEKTAVTCLKNGADYYLIKQEGWDGEIPIVMRAVMEDGEQRKLAKDRVKQLEAENLKLKQHVAIDAATRFYSPAHFPKIVAHELKRANRYGTDLTCVVLEIQPSQGLGETDHHEFYESLSLALKATMRSCDIWAKLEGHYFAALMPHTDQFDADYAIRRITSEINGMRIGRKKLGLKSAWGLASYDKDKIVDENELIEMAKDNLQHQSE